MDPKEARYKTISKWMAACLVAVAVLIEIIEAILGFLGIGDVGVDSAISVAADALFVFWFWMLGVTFMKNPGRMYAMMIQALVGLIPFLDILPELSIGVIYTIRSVWNEDEEAARSAIIEEQRVIEFQKETNRNRKRFNYSQETA